MDEQTLNSLVSSPLVTSNHLSCALESLANVNSQVKCIIHQRRLPERPLPDAAIQLFISQLAALDSNNFPTHAGVGEREGRVFSSLVRGRHFNMSHGVGRSGEIDSNQPKAAGASLLYQLCNIMALDACRALGLVNKRIFEEALVVPLSTGMALSLVLRSTANELRLANPTGPEPKYVVWCRIDQKTCLKCVAAAGLEAVVVPLRPAASPKTPKKPQIAAQSEEVPLDLTPPKYFVQSHADDIRAAINGCPGGASSVAAVLTTTSCFAPRLPDNVLAVARLCQELSVPHIINNAYGLQSPSIIAQLEAASHNGRVDAVIQSTDKNFMVPVGGAVILGPSKVVRAASKLYPGRASASPITDLFITLLAMGRVKYVALAHTNRLDLLHRYFMPKVIAFAASRGEEVVWDQRNDISFGLTLRNAWRSSSKPSGVTQEAVVAAAIAVGSKLFHLGITGPKVVFPSVPSGTEGSKGITAQQTVSGLTFPNYGLHGSSEHCTDCPPMLIFACAIGMEVDEVDSFMRRLAELYPAA